MLMASNPSSRNRSSAASSIDWSTRASRGRPGVLTSFAGCEAAFNLPAPFPEGGLPELPFHWRAVAQVRREAPPLLPAKPLPPQRGPHLPSIQQTRSGRLGLARSLVDQCARRRLMPHLPNRLRPKPPAAADWTLPEQWPRHTRRREYFQSLLRPGALRPFWLCRSWPSQPPPSRAAMNP